MVVACAALKLQKNLKLCRFDDLKTINIENNWKMKHIFIFYKGRLQFTDVGNDNSKSNTSFEIKWLWL